MFLRENEGVLYVGGGGHDGGQDGGQEGGHDSGHDSGNGASADGGQRAVVLDSSLVSSSALTGEPSEWSRYLHSETFSSFVALF